MTCFFWPKTDRQWDRQTARQTDGRRTDRQSDGPVHFQSPKLAQNCLLRGISPPLCGFLMWIGKVPKPFVLPLQLFPTITNSITFSQNSRSNRRYWRMLAAPVVANSEKNMCCPYVNRQGAQTLCFTVAKFPDDYKQYYLFTKLEK